ncbi:hypothetical protein EC957_010913 [Mortierella hygrophila]|uniref:Uncharacterized protein n=1 Tax=Mortierella hygrophila TaxID=979708 RepID=A0A9P6K4I1_9FUNG|nr:hypothetical protein EC957_010913 [Mortierella hygrophila]
MTAIIIKIASAIAVFVCAIQAAPLLSEQCFGSSCQQAASAGSVNVGSVTNVVPETNIIPVTRLQPVVKVHSALVQSDCDQSNLLGLSGMGGTPYYGRQGMMLPYGQFGRGDDSMFRYRMGRFARGPSTINTALLNPMMKRRIRNPSISNDMGAVLRPDCVPSATDNCVQTIPFSTTDMGSTVTAVPENIVLPSTVYQGKVKAGPADVYATEATHHSLPGQRVNLGSDTRIQPITKVYPSTTYQPSVDQKATMVEAAPAMDQSLGRSSVSLGSSVYIRPTTTVEPLTIFQPKIQSLPFIIHSETACDQDAYQQL